MNDRRHVFQWLEPFLERHHVRQMTQFAVQPEFASAMKTFEAVQKRLSKRVSYGAHAFQSCGHWLGCWSD